MPVQNGVMMQYFHWYNPGDGSLWKEAAARAPELARLIRERNGGMDVALIAMTGWGQAADRERTSEAGFDDHLVKPVEPTALASRLAAILSR